MYYKYPRTPHFSFSPGATSDDKILQSDDIFINKDIVITEKMDGENTTIYHQYYHARSIDSKHENYHSYLLSVVIPNIQYKIPDGWRVSGEYLYARHSIFYDNLPDYFLCFSVWDNNNICLSWKDTKAFCKKHGINIVPELYIGKYDENIIKRIALQVVDSGGEGIVVRNANLFSYEDFGNNMAKYVRKNHIQTDKHWKLGKIEKNNLKI